MANQLYPLGRQGFLEGNIHWLTDNIKVVLVDAADYTFSATHQFLSDIPSIARVATSGNLANKTSTNGVADADDISFGNVTGDVSEAIVIYQDSGTATTSRLIAYLDTLTGLPVTPNGGPINITWDSGANRIFVL